MDYYSKYLKYKNKYTTLKSYILKGGDNLLFSDNVILCVTHNNRLECFFRSIEKDYPNKAFNNCVVIKCYNENDKLKFKMIYEGESYNSKHYKKTAWTINSFNNFFNNNNYNINNIILPKNTDILLIRHALGVHNKMSSLEILFNFKKDSQLDVIGIEQSERAGIFLKKLLESKKLYFMASHLVRTQQTIAIIMKMINLRQPIYIVPCSHELNVVNNCYNSSCDNSILQKFPILSNMPKCKDNSNSCNKLTNFSGVDVYANYKVDLNWDYYINYNNNKCQNTNILEQIIKLNESL
jgi:broad specificity phosphatase PhoE